MRKPSSERPEPAELRMGLAQWGVLLVCAMLWGSAYVGNAIVIKELPHLTVTASRLFLAILVLVPIALAAAHRIPTDFKAWRPFFPHTLMSNVGPYLLVLQGQSHSASGLAAVLIATSPLFTILFAHHFTHDEKMRASTVLGILVGIAGVVVVMGPGALEGLTTDLLAKLALLGAAVLYAAGGVFAKRFVKYAPPVIATMQMTCGFLVTLPLALIFDRPWRLAQPSWTALAALIWVGVFGSALAAVTYFIVFRKAGATNAMLVTLLVPLTPIVLGWLLLGEVLEARELVGAAIIALGLIVIDRRGLGVGRSRG